MPSFAKDNAGLEVPGYSFVTEVGYQIRVVRAPVNLTSGGDTLGVAAVAGKRIRVLEIIAVADADVSLHLRSSTTPITAAFPLGAKGGVVIHSRHGICETAVGEALNLNLSGAVVVGVQLIYVQY